MSQTKLKPVFEQVADQDGVISASQQTDSTEPTISVDINIRQDDLMMYTTEDNQMLLRTSEMDENVFVQPVPTENGFTCEIVVNPTVEVVETQPAEPAEQPKVDAASYIETRMD